MCKREGEEGTAKMFLAKVQSILTSDEKLKGGKLIYFILLFGSVAWNLLKSQFVLHNLITIY